MCLSVCNNNSAIHTANRKAVPRLLTGTIPVGQEDVTNLELGKDLQTLQQCLIQTSPLANCDTIFLESIASNVPEAENNLTSSFM